MPLYFNIVNDMYNSWSSNNILYTIYTLSGFFLNFLENIRSLNLCNNKQTTAKMSL